MKLYHRHTKTGKHQTDYYHETAGCGIEPSACGTILYFSSPALSILLGAREHVRQVHDSVVYDLLSQPGYIGRSGKAELDADQDPAYLKALEDLKQEILILIGSMRDSGARNLWLARVQRTSPFELYWRFSVDFAGHVGTLHVITTS